MSLMPNRWTVCAVTALAVVVACRDARAFDAERMIWADRQIEAAIAAKQIPGAVLLVGEGNEVVYRKAYGQRALQPAPEPMTEDTLFDLASLSKVVGCATAVMMLIERGQLSLTDTVATHLPAFGVNGKDKITVEQLLLHRGGLIPDNPLSDYTGTPAEMLERICQLKTVYPPGTDHRYTDVGYIVLGELVRAIDGRPLDVFTREEIFEPLGMTDTAYRLSESQKARCAVTEQREGRWMRGEVHDPRAYALGGVAGHAGLFSTADDLARYCRMILAGGRVGEHTLLGWMTVREMTRPRCLPAGDGYRGYGWAVGTHEGHARGNLFPELRSFGHTGFTGTLFWLDPDSEAYVILLTNRVHPDGKGDVTELRRRVLTVAAAAIAPNPFPKSPAFAGDLNLDEPTAASAGATVQLAAATAPPLLAGPPEILCGLDVLERDGFKLLAGKRIALITNHTGLNRDGKRTVDLLRDAPNVKLVKLFSPEHGLYGQLDEKVGDTVDPATQLKVYSLYGQTRRPSPEMLADLDAVVFDIQDIGTRYYTYIATMGYAMEEAAKLSLEMIVLDRPNPITGVRIDGPIYDGTERAFTAYGPLPVVHGMTVGELARFANAEYGIGAKLTVVQVEGWRRSMWWDATGLIWTNPSPNMRNLTQAALYPCVGLIEACNVSVGRGTDQPFELFGAPWIDGRKLAAALNGMDLPGLRCVPITFTPTSSKYAKEACQGAYLIVTDREKLEPVRSGLTIAWLLRKLYGEQFEVDRMIGLLGNRTVLEALKSTAHPSALPALWAEDLARFQTLRAKHLIYAE